MDICMRENLNQMDLLSPSLSKVSEQEYYAKRRGQINLDLTNLELLGDGFTPVKTTFETEKEKIRNAITDVAKRSVSFMDFQNLLKLEYGILAVSYTHLNDTFKIIVFDSIICYISSTFYIAKSATQITVACKHD